MKIGSKIERQWNAIVAEARCVIETQLAFLCQKV